jgi:uncharacterized protein (DUF433 family)
MDQARDVVGMIGRGVYSVPEAARLVRIPSSRIGRWLGGRSRRYRGQRVYDLPLWTPDLPLIDDQLNLSFRDLIEVRMVDRFRERGLSLSYIRKVVEAAREIVGKSHPFASNSFKTDGKRLYYEVLSRTDEPKLIEVLGGQHVFHSIISIGLKDVEFEQGVLSLWRPESGRNDVILDPKRSFGQPILDESGVSTAIVKLAFDSGRRPRDISRDFEISERTVRSALAFEAKLAE